MILVLVFGFTGSAAADENAVGGIVRSKRDKRPLGYVSITLVQDQSISDKTGAEDGIYIVLVPKARESFDLLYQKDGFLSRKRRVDNQQRQNKIPIVELIPVEEIPSLSTDELELFVEEAIGLLRDGGGTRNIDKNIVARAGRYNLEQLRRNMPITGAERVRLKQRIERQLNSNL
jgi:hypothetical protein